MKSQAFLAGAVALCALCALSAVSRPVLAQTPAPAPCSSVPAVVDSARDDAFEILNSGRPLVVEMRQEQHATEAKDLTVAVVRERFICARIAGTFAHIIPPGVKFVVLKIGPLYYGRDPDQRRATGVFTDSLFRVLLRLDAAIESKSPPR